ncbi:inositol monophosphatase family protein [Marinospirillum alkaliphilum]|uniref:Inositol-1-monophosphatase n=1 Tax=Marinospirillum alkaliphilum DSM 21637 TaxID=1122209 RepID=A0A1K1XM82_9GAMM|nr:inositol monophosphatase family protein [Marinospirillum alkaliphilum]SFX50172.1 myo-inositol-1(or 4)-monophosphatase [Marinospirillum alkaliphilum DSM 21637]
MSSSPLSHEALQHRLRFAEKIALQAGQMMKQARVDGGFERNYKNHQELVTSTDKEIDNFLCSQLQAAFPDDRILSEENITDTQGAAEAPALWILDPIDGTVNFAHGQPHVAVSIGFYSHGVPQIGVVHAPFLEESFSAIRGQGAYRNNQPIHVSGLTHLRPALIASGFPYDKTQLAPLINRLAVLLPQCQDLRRCGSAALDICHVADGSLDGYYESLSLWDFAAAVLIAEEAGAQLSHLYPSDFVGLYLDTRDWIITTPGIHHELKQCLLDADGD